MKPLTRSLLGAIALCAPTLFLMRAPLVPVLAGCLAATTLVLRRRNRKAA